MQKKLLTIFVLICVVIAGCTTNIDKPFIISAHQRAKSPGRSHQFFYSKFNIILNPDGVMYFHNKDSALYCCDTGEDKDSPDFIDLKPADLIVYTDSNIAQLADQLADLPRDDKHSLQIASFTDSISDPTFYRIAALLQQKNITNYDVRLATEEEQTVATAKTNNAPYDFYKHRWKSRFSNSFFPPPPFDSTGKQVP